MSTFEPVQFDEPPAVIRAREAVAKALGTPAVMSVAVQVCSTDDKPSPVWVKLAEGLWFGPLGAIAPEGVQVWRGAWQDGWVRPSHVHQWRETEVYCEDCGSHPAVTCEGIDDDPACDLAEPIDLIYHDDPCEEP